MPRAQGTSNPELMKDRSGGQPSNFSGVIKKVFVAPDDWRGAKGQQGGESPWTRPYSPWHLAAHLYIVPDETQEDSEVESFPFWHKLDIGYLEWWIASTSACDDDAIISDIPYPGKPEHPGGLDLDAFTDAARELWEAVLEEGSETPFEKMSAYSEKLRSDFGGSDVFALGRDLALPLRTQYCWFLETLIALKGFPLPSNEVSPATLLTGVRGHFDLVQFTRKGSKKPIELLCLSRYFESDSITSTTSSKPVIEVDSNGSVLAAKITKKLEEKGVLVGKDLRSLCMGAPFDVKDRPTNFQLINNLEFLSKLGSYDEATKELTYEG